jgi:dihydroorotate dehydrogenase (fumarate)
VISDSGIAADQVETEMLETVGLIAGAVKIPVAVKISPFHTAIAQLAVALELAGAAGVVIFNRFYQPDIHVDEVEVQPMLRLSDPQELLVRLRWLAILSPQLRGSLAATGGVHAFDGAVKAILAGAHAVQLVSVLLKHGPHTLVTLVEGLQRWMTKHGFENIDAFRGLLNSQRCRDASAFERANYIRTLQSWKV